MSGSTDMAVTAPGKLYLFGEYGVLAGGWAVVAAVDRRVVAGRRSESDQYSVRGADTDDVALVEAVLEAVEAETDRHWRPGHFETDVSELYDGGEKLGLGSSAASCVALAAAAMIDAPEELDEEEVREAIFAVAERAHRDFQGGQGSGGGIVASILGGVTGLRRHHPTPMFSRQRIEVEEEGVVEERRTIDHFDLTSVSLPSAIEVRPIWLGARASTTSFLGTVERMLKLEPGEVYRQLRKTGEVARDALAACGDDDTDGFFDAVVAGERAMEELAKTLEVPVLSEGHYRLREATDGLAILVKPSGAGGGDFSLAFGTEATDWQAVEERLPAGFRVIDMEFGVEGVRGAEE